MALNMSTYPCTMCLVWHLEWFVLLGWGSEEPTLLSRKNSPLLTRSTAPQMSFFQRGLFLCLKWVPLRLDNHLKVDQFWWGDERHTPKSITAVWSLPMCFVVNSLLLHSHIVIGQHYTVHTTSSTRSADGDEDMETQLCSSLPTLCTTLLQYFLCGGFKQFWGIIPAHVTTPSLGKKDLRKGKIQDIKNIFLLRYQLYTVQETLSNLYLNDSCSV